jgi:hypothetical protein
MDWCSVYLTPRDLPKYIYLSPPLIFPTTYNGIMTKNRTVWTTLGAAPIRWMGPIRNPRWEQKRSERYVHICRRICIHLMTMKIQSSCKNRTYCILWYHCTPPLPLNRYWSAKFTNQLVYMKLKRVDHRYDNVTFTPLLLPARVTNRSHSTYGSKYRFRGRGGVQWYQRMQ